MLCQMLIVIFLIVQRYEIIYNYKLYIEILIYISKKRAEFLSLAQKSTTFAMEDIIHS